MTTLVATELLPGGVPPKSVIWTLFLAGDEGRPIIGYVDGTEIISFLQGRLAEDGSLSIEDIVPNADILPTGTRYGLKLEVAGRSLGARFLDIHDTTEVTVEDALSEAPGALPAPQTEAALADLDGRLEAVEAVTISDGGDADHW